MSSEATIYSKLGGAGGIGRLVQDFYHRMDTLDSARQIRELHPADLTESIEKLRDFLIGWTGGPPAYVQKHGHPKLRWRHLPFAIDSAARDQWLLCMSQALDAHAEATPMTVEVLMGAFSRMADHLRNQPDAT